MCELILNVWNANILGLYFLKTFRPGSVDFRKQRQFNCYFRAVQVDMSDFYRKIAKYRKGYKISREMKVSRKQKMLSDYLSWISYK